MVNKKIVQTLLFPRLRKPDSSCFCQISSPIELDLVENRVVNDFRMRVIIILGKADINCVNFIW